MENRSHSGGRSKSYFPSWLLESTWDVVGPSQPAHRTRVMSPTGKGGAGGQLRKLLWLP